MRGERFCEVCLMKSKSELSGYRAFFLKAVLGALILHHFRFLDRNVFARISALVWCLLGLILVALYRHFYWT